MKTATEKNVAYGSVSTTEISRNEFPVENAIKISKWRWYVRQHLWSPKRLIHGDFFKLKVSDYSNKIHHKFQILFGEFLLLKQHQREILNLHYRIFYWCMTP